MTAVSEIMMGKHAPLWKKTDFLEKYPETQTRHPKTDLVGKTQQW